MDKFYGIKTTLQYSTALFDEPPQRINIKPKHICHIMVGETVYNPPIYRDGIRVMSEWNFKSHDAYAWLIENCQDWRWDWANVDEYDYDYMKAEIYFYGDEADAMAFKLKWC